MFRVKEGTANGTYDISVTAVEARNADGQKVTFADAVAEIKVVDYIAGDADGDGEVTDWDSILLKRYLAGWTVEINLDAMDVDGDGEVNDGDDIILDRFLAFWPDVELQ